MAENGTRKAVAEAVFHIVLPWKILNHVVPLSYDTYSINAQIEFDFETLICLNNKNCSLQEFVKPPQILTADL